MAFDLLVNPSDQGRGLIDLATQLYFQHHRQLGIFNNPEIAELEEGGWLKKAKQILAIKEDNRVRSMVIIRQLIPRIFDNVKVRTFRPRAYRHKLYQVYCTSYPNRRCEKCPHCVIEMKEVIEVNVKDIKDSWAKDAGTRGKKDLLQRLEGWYGNKRKTYFMHTFKVVHGVE